MHSRSRTEGAQLRISNPQQSPAVTVPKMGLDVQVLSAQQILSAPVVACSESDAPDDCTDVIGFIDIRDVLVSFLSGTINARFV